MGKTDQGTPPLTKGHSRETGRTGKRHQGRQTVVKKQTAGTQRYAIEVSRFASHSTYIEHRTSHIRYSNE